MWTRTNEELTIHTGFLKPVSLKFNASDMDGLSKHPWLEVLRPRKTSRQKWLLSWRPSVPSHLGDKGAGERILQGFICVAEAAPCLVINTLALPASPGVGSPSVYSRAHQHALQQ